MQYWIIVDGHHDGPYSAERLLASGLMPNTLVWCEGLPDWVPAADVPELAEAMRRRDAYVPQQPAEPEVPADATQIEVEMETVEVTETSEELPEEQPCEQPNSQQPDAPRAPQQGYARQQPAPQQPMQEMPECPPAPIAWSIIVTVLCCVVLGVPAVIFASMTKTAYYRGDYKKAKKYSELSQWFVILAIVVGLLVAPFQMALMGLFNNV